MKNLIITLLVFISFNTFSQTIYGVEPFIEVKISDTLMVSPDYVKFLVEIKKEDTYDDYWGDYDNSYDSATRTKKDSKPKEKENKEEKTKNQIQTVLDKYKLEYYFHEEQKGSAFSLDPGVYSNAFEITIQNISLLEKIRKELSEIENLKVKVLAAEVKNKHPYELQLIERLMKKAMAEAEAIAKAMGVTLGNPLNVTNQSMSDIYTSMFNNPESMGGMGAMFSLLGNMFKSPGQQEKVSIGKSLVVRYGYK